MIGGAGFREVALLGINVWVGHRLQARFGFDVMGRFGLAYLLQDLGWLSK